MTAGETNGGPSAQTSAATSIHADTATRFMGGLWQLNRRMKLLVTPILADFPDLDLQRFIILRSIQGGVSYPKDLSQALQIIPTQLSRSLDLLVTQGLIERRHDALDSRRTRLSLTPAGQTLCENVSRAVMTAVSLRLQAFPPERLSAVVAAVELLSSEGGLLDFRPASASPLSVPNPPEQP